MNKMKIKKDNFQILKNLFRFLVCSKTNVFDIFTFKRKMNKRAILWETLADVFLAGLVLLLAISLSTLVINQTNKNIEENIEAKALDFESNELFMSYLSTEIQNMSFFDYIIYYYINQEDIDIFSNNTDILFENIYNTKVCWKISINNDEFAKLNTCKKKEHLLDSTILMPLPNTYTINLTLNISGYANE